MLTTIVPERGADESRMRAFTTFPDVHVCAPCRHRYTRNRIPKPLLRRVTLHSRLLDVRLVLHPDTCHHASYYLAPTNCVFCDTALTEARDGLNRAPPIPFTALVITPGGLPHTELIAEGSPRYITLAGDCPLRLYLGNGAYLVAVEGAPLDWGVTLPTLRQGWSRVVDTYDATYDVHGAAFIANWDGQIYTSLTPFYVDLYTQRFSPGREE